MSRFPVLAELAEKAKSTMWCNQMLIQMDEEMQRDNRVINDLLHTLRVIQDGSNQREELMVEVRQQKHQLKPYITLQVLRELQRKDGIRMMELRQVITDLQLSIHKKKEFAEAT
ncbi:hypothetical protein Tco_0082469, partial [Tanacetum coccineum]